MGPLARVRHHGAAVGRVDEAGHALGRAALLLRGAAFFEEDLSGVARADRDEVAAVPRTTTW
ncbi:hypothetical protein [Nocardioides sp.]|uniref:hypothetical protein n=1 Tax=Nocardioides sp. TaxID=35761 RepID=UPI0025F7B552|nr:hypothetical protein [Nocardioides sp.]